MCATHGGPQRTVFDLPRPSPPSFPNHGRDGGLSTLRDAQTRVREPLRTAARNRLAPGFAGADAKCSLSLRHYKGVAEVLDKFSLIDRFWMRVSARAHDPAGSSNVQSGRGGGDDHRRDRGAGDLRRVGTAEGQMPPVAAARDLRRYRTPIHTATTPAALHLPARDACENAADRVRSAGRPDGGDSV